MKYLQRSLHPLWPCMPWEVIAPSGLTCTSLTGSVCSRLGSHRMRSGSVTTWVGRHLQGGEALSFDAEPYTILYQMCQTPSGQTEQRIGLGQVPSLLKWVAERWGACHALVSPPSDQADMR